MLELRSATGDLTTAGDQDRKRNVSTDMEGLAIFTGRIKLSGDYGSPVVMLRCYVSCWETSKRLPILCNKSNRFFKPCFLHARSTWVCPPPENPAFSIPLLYDIGTTAVGREMTQNILTLVVEKPAKPDSKVSNELFNVLLNRRSTTQILTRPLKRRSPSVRASSDTRRHVSTLQGEVERSQGPPEA